MGAQLSDSEKIRNLLYELRIKPHLRSSHYLEKVLFTMYLDEGMSPQLAIANAAKAMEVEPASVRKILRQVLKQGFKKHPTLYVEFIKKETMRLKKLDILLCQMVRRIRAEQNKEKQG